MNATVTDSDFTSTKSLSGGTVAVIRYRSQLAVLLLTPYSLEEVRAEHLQLAALGLALREHWINFGLKQASVVEAL